MGTRDVPLPRLFKLLHGEDRDRWPPEARFIAAAHRGDVRDMKKIAKELDVQGRGVPATVASTTYIGMNALHAAAGRSKLPAYQYLVEEVGMDVVKPDTAQEFTPVVHAVTTVCLPAVKYLLNHGADVQDPASLFSCRQDPFFPLLPFPRVAGPRAAPVCCPGQPHAPPRRLATLAAATSTGSPRSVAATCFLRTKNLCSHRPGLPHHGRFSP